MKREDRYLVLKYKDINKHLNATEQAALAELVRKVDGGRRAEGKPIIECAVVESDWPEYLDTWSRIAARVDRVTFREARMQQFNDYDKDKQS